MPGQDLFIRIGKPSAHIQDHVPEPVFPQALQQSFSGIAAAQQQKGFAVLIHHADKIPLGSVKTCQNRVFPGDPQPGCQISRRGDSRNDLGLKPVRTPGKLLSQFFRPAEKSRIPGQEHSRVPVFAVCFQERNDPVCPVFLKLRFPGQLRDLPGALEHPSGSDQAAALPDPFLRLRRQQIRRSCSDPDQGYFLSVLIHLCTPWASPFFPPVPLCRNSR